MYLDYFGLSEKPFSITSDPNFLFESDMHASVLKALIYGVESRAGIMALVGEIGTGKTTLAHTLIDRISKHTQVSLLLNPIFEPLDLLKAINADFGISAQGSKKELLDELNSFLLESLDAQMNSLIIVDEAQNLSIESLETIRLLSNLETRKNKILQILLIGQPQLKEKLADPELLQLNQRIAVRCQLKALTKEDSQFYILHRLAKANASGKIVFDNRMLKHIFNLTAGYPRMINLLCDRILLTLYAQGESKVNKKVIRKAYEDLWGKQAPITQLSKSTSWTF